MKQILIIEDDNHTANTLSDGLRKQGYGTKIAHTASEGIEYYEQMECDLIILDLTLPERDGMEVLEEICTMSIVPVIVLTDRDSKNSAASLIGTGANDYLTKPFYFSELLVRIEVQLSM
jgi:two-component system KDP operon response regulator KdpE